MTARVYAARIPARLLLRTIWNRSESPDPSDVLRAAPNAAAAYLNLTVEHVPAIFGDNQIAGVLDRTDGTILVATKFSFTSQRFTLAHELGHFVLHPGQTFFRDRELSAPGRGNRSCVEVEADAFAAEFLMPRNYLRSVFLQMFGGALDTRVPNQDIADAISASTGNRQICDPHAFCAERSVFRAEAIAKLNSFRGRFFKPLAEQFSVSRRAMAIQLLQTELVV